MGIFSKIFKSRGATRIRGKNNSVMVVENGTRVRSNKVAGLRIDVKGEGNQITIHLPQKFENCQLIVRGDNNVCEFGATSKFSVNTNYYLDSKANNRELKVGSNLLCAGANMIVALEGSKFSIGDDCMFSYQVQIRNHDGHTLFDKKTKKPLHKGREMYIGDRVWLGFRTLILKNVTLADGTVVGAGSIVVKDQSKPDCVIAGCPAKVVREGVGWVHENVDTYLENVKK